MSFSPAAQSIIDKGTKSADFEEFAEALSNISQQYHFPSELLTHLYAMIDTERKQGFLFLVHYKPIMPFTNASLILPHAT